ncbi:MAG: winged helix-turn-helix transcriptional regulator [archaeon]
MKKINDKKAEVDDLLGFEEKKKGAEINNSEKKIIKYLLSLKNDKLVMSTMAKETGLSRITVNANFERLQKNKIITSTWKLNPFALGFKIIEVELKYNGKDENTLLDILKKHPAITDIKRCYQNSFRADIIVREIDDFKEIEKFLRSKGADVSHSEVIIENIS